ncbi:uncharacterized protein CELE_F44G4.3 [Caenorhabditis elegans]|uniref:Uncharacterized protein n=1 Tax=Caenorhabditis elegans TaxID=6239 RepID=Q20413_CAEEL|nr:Uncharacterized protein CELE_F44G4.3 [Caenorhabditis elegans]CAA90119.1 Uncharacterized protein CELE_F44G4.3 [Caenorhabditis elegans]|eukprot:NP_495920.1 Uncharacterized protein CELE_F44G4.3 [Caenorhabditis elegans]
MEGDKNVVMSSKPTGKANWKIKFHKILSYPMKRTGPAIVASTLLYIVMYNVGVRWWKGDKHPVNRFMWKIQEQEGRLDPTLQAKKQVVLSYQEERVYRPRDNVPDLGIV